MKKNFSIFLSLSIILITCTTLYLSIVNAQNNTHQLNEICINKWTGKTWLTLGDSISKANTYQENLKNSLGFSNIENLALNGQTMAYQKKNQSTYTVGKNIDYTKYDLVSIFIGTNDFRYNKELGEIKHSGSSNFNENTFIGSYQLLIENILASNPKINLVLITPLQRVRDGYDIDFTNPAGSKLIDYVNAIKDLGEMYSLPVLDLYSESGITKQTINTFTRDGLHPNKEGYKRISEKIYRFLLSI